ncbi:MAG: hypothetical protein JST80_03985 [Bdellovibrionales bacterium]|nr:hypothetical protein [Bdellovibrionales bacterium]
MKVNQVLFIALLSHLASSQATDWRIAYEGMGKADIKAHGVSLSPKAAKRLSETHSALALSTETERHPVKDFTIEFKYRVRAQLRIPASEIQPWETLWLFFNYRPDGEFKKTNYLILKTNGIEVGKAWGEIDQKFVHTADEPKLIDPSEWHTFRVTKQDGHLSVQIDRGPVRQINVDTNRELYTEPGAIGLYTEDADVQIEDIRYQALESTGHSPAS